MELQSGNTKSFSALLAICAGNSSPPPHTHTHNTHRPVTRSFDAYFNLPESPPPPPPPHTHTHTHTHTTHTGQWRGALMLTLICARINAWVYNSEAGDLRRYLPHYDVIVMIGDFLSRVTLKFDGWSWKTIVKKVWQTDGQTYGRKEVFLKLLGRS